MLLPHAASDHYFSHIHAAHMSLGSLICFLFFSINLILTDTLFFGMSLLSNSKKGFFLCKQITLSFKSQKAAVLTVMSRIFIPTVLMFHSITVYLYFFNQINSDLVSIRDLFHKSSKKFKQ